MTAWMGAKTSICGKRRGHVIITELKMLKASPKNNTPCRAHYRHYHCSASDLLHPHFGPIRSAVSKAANQILLRGALKIARYRNDVGLGFHQDWGARPERAVIPVVACVHVCLAWHFAAILSSSLGKYNAQPEV